MFGDFPKKTGSFNNFFFFNLKVEASACFELENKTPCCEETTVMRINCSFLIPGNVELLLLWSKWRGCNT